MRGTWIFYGRTFDGDIQEYHLTRQEAEDARDLVGSGDILRIQISVPNRKLNIWTMVNTGVVTPEMHIFGFQQL